MAVIKKYSLKIKCLTKVENLLRHILSQTRVLDSRVFPVFFKFYVCLYRTQRKMSDFRKNFLSCSHTLTTCLILSCFCYFFVSSFSSFSLELSHIFRNVSEHAFIRRMINNNNGNMDYVSKKTHHLITYHRIGRKIDNFCDR